MRLDAPPMGSLALDFLHTHRRNRSGSLDIVRTPEALAAWLITHAGERAASVLREPLQPPAGRLLLDEAQRLRSDIGVLVASFSGSGTVDVTASFGINRVLAACPRSWLLGTEAGRPVLLEHEHAQGHIQALAGVAEAAARLVATVEPARIRACALDSCGAWFVDTSRSGRRRWCSMAGCGNRAKASTHRSKRRAL
jgi:predicted RNA-binding Zn ribbon-like protein